MQCTNDPLAFRRELQRPVKQDRPAAPQTKRRRSVPLHAFAKLSFVEVAFDSAGAPYLDMWAVRRTDNYTTDTAAGRAYANELVSYIRAHDAPSLLVQVWKAIVNRGAWTGVEIGFCHALAVISMRSGVSLAA